MTMMKLLMTLVGMMNMIINFDDGDDDNDD